MERKDSAEMKTDRIVERKKRQCKAPEKVGRDGVQGRAGRPASGNKRQVLGASEGRRRR